MTEDATNEQQAPCPLCHGSKCLTKTGVTKVYLLSSPIPVLLIVVGTIGGLVYSTYCFMLAITGFIIPLANADLRLTLFPIALIAHAMGKKLNCPKCEPHSSMFRNS